MSFKDGHTRQETAHVDCGENDLICQYSGCYGGTVALKVYLSLQKGIPLGGSRTKNGFAGVS